MYSIFSSGNFTETLNTPSEQSSPQTESEITHIEFSESKKPSLETTNISLTKSSASTSQVCQQYDAINIVLSILIFYFLLVGIIGIILSQQSITWSVQLQCPNNKTNINTNTNTNTNQPQLTCTGTTNIQHTGSLSIYLFVNSANQKDFLRSEETENQYSTNQQLNKTISINNTPLNPSLQAIPCGYFQSQYPQSNLKIIQNNQPLLISKSFTVFTNDYINDNLTKQWVDFNEDTQFESWMEDNVYLSVVKLWGSINVNFTGNYEVTLECMFLDYLVRNNLPILFNEEIHFMFMNNNIVSANYELCAINFLFAFILAIFSKLIMTLEPRKNTRTIYTNHTTFKIECNVESSQETSESSTCHNILEPRLIRVRKISSLSTFKKLLEDVHTLQTAISNNQHRENHITTLINKETI